MGSLDTVCPRRAREPAGSSIKFLETNAEMYEIIAVKVLVVVDAVDAIMIFNKNTKSSLSWFVLYSNRAVLCNQLFATTEKVSLVASSRSCFSSCLLHEPKDPTTDWHVQDPFVELVEKGNAILSNQGIALVVVNASRG
jgi:hypothetical protein